MNKIERVQIRGLWGKRNFQCDFDPQTNFLIGRNGSGKTTIINLMSAALTLDFATLEMTDFAEIHFTLKSANSKNRPEIKVSKVRHNDGLYSEVIYSLRNKPSEEYRVFDLNDADQRILFRKAAVWRAANNKRLSELSISEELKKLVKVTWLSINRSPQGTSENASRDFQSPIDNKVYDLSNRLVRYFSGLGSEVKKLEEKVQRAMFLSLLAAQNEASAVTPQLLEQEKEGLTQIFRNFGIPEQDYQGRLEHHFDLSSKALKKLGTGNNPSAEEFHAVMATFRIGFVVEEWNDFLERQKNVMSGRDNFISILNNLMENKTFTVTPVNELSATIKDADDKKRKAELPLNKLSSGEKQLLIILGEALLQEQRANIYIADEPELSLHVEWQENLVENIQRLNPNAQIIFATHSPDIVSCFDSNVKDVKDLLK